MLPRRVYHFFAFYSIGLGLLLAVKYGLDLSDYVIPAPLDIWRTASQESLRYLADVLDTLYVFCWGTAFSRGCSLRP